MNRTQAIRLVGRGFERMEYAFQAFKDIPWGMSPDVSKRSHRLFIKSPKGPTSARPSKALKALKRRVVFFRRYLHHAARSNGLKFRETYQLPRDVDCALQWSNGSKTPTILVNGTHDGVRRFHAMVRELVRFVSLSISTRFGGSISEVELNMVAFLVCDAIVMADGSVSVDLDLFRFPDLPKALLESRRSTTELATGLLLDLWQ